MNSHTLEAFEDELEKIAISDELAGKAMVARSAKETEARGISTRGLSQFSPSSLKRSAQYSKELVKQIPEIAKGGGGKAGLHIRRMQTVKNPGEYFRGMGKGLSSRGNKISGGMMQAASKLMK